MANCFCSFMRFAKYSTEHCSPSFRIGGGDGVGDHDDWDSLRGVRRTGDWKNIGNYLKMIVFSGTNSTKRNQARHFTRHKWKKATTSEKWKERMTKKKWIFPGGTFEHCIWARLQSFFCLRSFNNCCTPYTWNMLGEFKNWDDLLILRIHFLFFQVWICPRTRQKSFLLWYSYKCQK